MIVDQKAGHQPGTKDEENQSDSVTQESSSQCSSYIRKALLSQEPEVTGFPRGSERKESAYNMGDMGSVPGLGRPLGEGHGNPL